MSNNRQIDLDDYVSPIARRGMQMAEHLDWKCEVTEGDTLVYRLLDAQGVEVGLGEVDGWKNARTADDRTTLRSKAMGRALKAAGYPSSRRDLHFIKGYRAMLAGAEESRPAQAATAPEPAAAQPTPDADAEDQPDDAATDGATNPWPGELGDIIDQLDDTARAEVEGWARQRGTTPDSPDGKLRALTAYARSKLPRTAPAPATAPPSGQSGPSEGDTPPPVGGEPASGSADQGGTPDPVEALLNRYAELPQPARDELDEAMAKALISWTDLDGDAEALGTVVTWIEQAEALVPASA